MSKTSRPPKVEVELGGEKYTMTFDLNALERVVDDAHFDIYDEKAWEGLVRRPGTAKTLAWCFLVGEHPELTPEALGAAMGIGDVRTVAQKIVEGIKASMPEAEEVTDEGNGVAKKRPRKRRASPPESSSSAAA